MAAVGGPKASAFAFARYEEQFRGYAKISQRGSAGPFLAPPSPLKHYPS
jgi:hypothetical protein